MWQVLSLFKHLFLQLFFLQENCKSLDNRHQMENSLVVFEKTVEFLKLCSIVKSFFLCGKSIFNIGFHAVFLNTV